MLGAGVGLVLPAIGFWLGGAEHPLTAFGFLVDSVAGFVWAFWLARLSFTNQLYAMKSEAESWLKKS
jgi:hypothetical protein